MIVGIYLDVDNFIIDPSISFHHAWKKTLKDITCSENINDDDFKKIINKLKTAHVAEDYQEILKKSFNMDFNDVSYGSLIKSFNENYCNFIKLNKNQISVDTEFLNQIFELSQKHKMNFYLLNDSLLAHCLIEELDILKQYPFLQLTWDQMPTHKNAGVYWLDESVAKWDNSATVLNVLISKYQDKDAVIWCVNNKKKFNLVQKLNIFTVTHVNNKLFAGNYVHDPEQGFNFDQILYSIYTKEENTI